MVTGRASFAGHEVKIGLLFVVFLLWGGEGWQDDDDSGSDPLICVVVVFRASTSGTCLQKTAASCGLHYASPISKVFLGSLIPLGGPCKAVHVHSHWSKTWLTNEVVALMSTYNQHAHRKSGSHEEKNWEIDCKSKKIYILCFGFSWIYALLFFNINTDSAQALKSSIIPPMIIEVPK